MYQIDPFNFSECSFKSCSKRKDAYTLFEFSSRPNKSSNDKLKTFVVLKTYTLKTYCRLLLEISNFV